MAIAKNASVGRQMLYEPLSRNTLEIRVLDLEQSIEYDSVISCRLRKFSLLEAEMESPSVRSLEALSYTWGDGSALTDIIINDQTIPVNVNLEAFLRRRREVNQKVTLWVDAICINQDDALEKNSQIPLMNMIYAFAPRLTIWLGPGSDDSTLAIEWLVDLGSGSPYNKMPILDRKDLMALQNLLSRPWWTRIWIIQELVAGGMGCKQKHITVRCGKDSVLWTNVVVAAVRMKAYHDALRQTLPNIDNILELDSLRESAYEFITNSLARSTSFDLLCRYRHFLASNPRDKLYAICNMFCKSPSAGMAARYDVCVREIYIDFAVDKIWAEKDLGILRYCGLSAHDLPSWVPDWSVPLGPQPLPLGRARRYFNVPWWADPIQLKSHRHTIHDGTTEHFRVHYPLGPYPSDSIAAARQRQLRLKRLEISAQGGGIVKDFEEIPLDFTIHGMSAELKEQFRELLSRGNVPLTVADERCFAAESPHFGTEQPDALKQGEIITERRVKKWLVQELKESHVSTPYSAAVTTEVDVKIDKHQSTLKAKGILWETIEICHEGFVGDLVADWKNTTRFMVAVGSCKAIALAHGSGAERYPTLQKRLEAFWSTLFAGQDIEPDQSRKDQASQEQLFYTDWLPEIPPCWTAADPPVTATTNGLVELAELSEAVNQTRDIFQADDDGTQSSEIEFVSLPHENYDPEQWSEGDKEQHETDLRVLASMWRQQPYDLYHRPFSFLYIVPDPYWETRKHGDELARRHTRRYRCEPILSQPPANSRTNEEEGVYTREDLPKISSAVHDNLIRKPSMVPQGTLKPGIEQYALGRKFFITEGGYFGLGPKDTRKGDRVAIFFGSNVPFVLREHEWEMGGRGWQLIGETYVHGAMEGEVIGLWEQGLVEAVTIPLR